MAATKKTDNHYTGDKVAIRIANSPWDIDRELTVLDCFGGRGIIWRAVQRKSGKKVNRTAIDKRTDIIEFHFHGENSKVLLGLCLKKYDVIDLDAYGIPVEQIDILVGKGFSGTVFVTAIQTMHGQLPKKMLDDLGFPENIAKKCPTLVGRRGWDYFKQWLALKGVSKIIHRSKQRKHYLCFKLNDAAQLSAGLDNQAEEKAANPSLCSA